MQQLITYLFAGLLLIHGLIHFAGFAKAFGSTKLSTITVRIGKTGGIMWLLVGLLFLAVVGMVLMEYTAWWMIAIVGVIASQALIISTWKDARFGSILNLIILVAAILTMGNDLFEKSFEHDLKICLQRSDSLPAPLLTEADLQSLPLPVQHYLRNSGVVNKPKIHNARIIFNGEMRGKAKDYFSFTSQQYNFFDTPARLFFMKAKMFGINIPGYHRFSDGEATMDIRFFGLFSIVKHEGAAMNKTETVTLLNDMCLLAPASLIDRRIAWQAIDSNHCKAVFTSGNIVVSALLSFNEDGDLIDFVSDDRMDVSDMKFYPWSTPVHDYQNLDGLHIMRNGDAVWHYDDGPFTYGKFTLQELAYNVQD